jgi:hypothetical protein
MSELPVPRAVHQIERAKSVAMTMTLFSHGKDCR